MNIPYYQINSFTAEGFRGNPAGVCLLEEWLTDEQMQYIATENNLSETAFVVREEADYRIRWFTPSVEVDLCGHATLASAGALMEYAGLDADMVRFNSRSGWLTVQKENTLYIMDFPADDLHKAEISPVLSDAFGIAPEEVYKGKTDLMLVFNNESVIRNLTPDMNVLMTLKERGVIVTGPGDQVDFVSRFFAPQSGIAEDPVTGSAHTTLTPYWANRTGKDQLIAWQVSHRGGLVKCMNRGERIGIAGEISLYIGGTIIL
jgi:PhzF family phenazine biosynthesis protein